MLFVRANSAAHGERCTVRHLAAFWREQEYPVRRRPSGSGKVKVKEKVKVKVKVKVNEDAPERCVHST